MAQNFRNSLTRETGATPVDILPEALVDSYDAVVGVRGSYTCRWVIRIN